MSKKNEKTKFQFRELFTNKQYRSIMILIFYVVLFAVLIMAIRSPSKTYNGTGGQIVTSLDGYELIDNKNFSYKYTIMVDDIEYVFDGSKFKDKEIVTLTSEGDKREYYIEKDKTYVKENNVYKSIIDKPIIVFDFFDTDILDQLIIRGVLIDEKVHRYKIDNQKLYDVLNEDSTKVESGENYITLNYRNSNITKIVFELDNYSKIIGENYDKVIISLEYYDFNLIEDFNDITVE